jgi:hypothetical protein
MTHYQRRRLGVEPQSIRLDAGTFVSIDLTGRVLFTADAHFLTTLLPDNTISRS